MGNTFKIKSRASDSTAPTTSNIENREIAINIPSKTIFINDAGTIKPISNYINPAGGAEASGNWPINVTGSAATLATSRTISITGGVTGTATGFDGSSDISIPITSMDAAGLSTGIVPKARLSGQYDGIGVKLDPTLSFMSADTGGRAAMLVGNHISNADPGTGCIIFKLPVKPTSSTRVIAKILGTLITGGSTPTLVDSTITGLTNASGVWLNNFERFDSGTFQPRIRLANDASGYPCIIIGDVALGLRYPSFQIYCASATSQYASDGNDARSDAFMGKWTSTGSVTDLSSYTIASELFPASLPYSAIATAYGSLGTGVGPVYGFTTTGGSGYTNGTYNTVALTGGTGQGALANITISGGTVTSFTLVRTGGDYTPGDVLGVNASDVGGTGSGFSLTVSSVKAALLDIISNGSQRIRVRNATPVTAALAELGSLNFGSMDTTTGGYGDTVIIRGVATGNAGGGMLDFYTAQNAAEPYLAARITDTNTFQLYSNSYLNNTGCYTEIISPASSIRTLTLANADTTLVGGTMVPTTGTGATGTWGIGITGSAATLTTARLISVSLSTNAASGTAFNGSAAVTIGVTGTLPTNKGGTGNTAGTVAKWTTARNLTIGGTAKALDGSQNVSWSLSEIGAAPISLSTNAVTANATTTLGTTHLNVVVEKTNTTAYTYTLAAGLGVRGDCITVVNSGTTGDITISRDTGVALYQGGVDGNVTVGPCSMVTLYRSNTSNRWIC